MTDGTLRLATRGSALARRQAALVQEALEERRYDVELVTVETTGDRLRDELIHRLGKTGAFVRELDERVLEGEVDAAVHSMKDVPTEQPADLVTAAVPERGTPGDALVTPDGTPLEELPEGAVVGTSSLRRRAQLLSKRPDLVVEPLRGNVDTRIEKVLAPALQAEHERRVEAEEGDGSDGDEDGDEDRKYDRTPDEWFDGLSEIEKRALGREVETTYDAIVLAEVGLDRSGLAQQVDYHRLPTTEFTPAPGQGALAVTARDGQLARDVRNAIDHPRSRAETTAERILLAELGGGCIAPVGIYAVVQGEYLHAAVSVYDRNGEESVTATRDLPIERYPEAAREFAADLEQRGAAELIERARKAVGDDESGDDGPGNDEPGDDEPGDDGPTSDDSSATGSGSAPGDDGPASTNENGGGDGEQGSLPADEDLPEGK